MNDADPDLDRLDELLCAISAGREVMTVAGLDGYVAALIVCPDMVTPSEWLPGIWGEEHAFADTAGAEAVIGAVMGHYNRIARELAEAPEDYAPVLEFDPDDGEILWEPWVDGFERAMRLRPDAWEEIALSGDREATTSLGMIVTLNDFSYGRLEFTEEAGNELDLMAPGLIPEFVRKLNEWTRSRQMTERATVGPSDAGFDSGDAPSFGRKAGANEPCPCGSGRTYGRCCGAH